MLGYTSLFLVYVESLSAVVLVETGVSCGFFILLNLNKTMAETVGKPIIQPGYLLLIQDFARTMCQSAHVAEGDHTMPFAILSLFLSRGSI